MFVAFIDPKHRPSKEKITSMVVNAHGGLVRMRAKLRRGQKLTILNSRKSQTAMSHVVWTRVIPDDLNFVAFEFDQPTPSIWPVIGLPESWRTATGEQRRLETSRSVSRTGR